MIVSDFISEKKDEPTVLCLGGFDSIHKGHAALIEEAKRFAAKNGGIVAVTVFSEEGKVFSRKKGEVFSICERVDILDSLGVNEAIVVSFTEEFSKLSPLDFLDEIFDNRLISGVFCGTDFRFGCNGSGDVNLLEEYCKRKNASFSAMPFITDENGEKISTSSVKSALARGAVRECFERYGVKYFIKGEVVHGRREGVKLGFPTANVIPAAEKFPLESGVYASTVTVGGVKYRAITNLGAAPTFGVENRVMECHIDGFDGDLYGKTISVYFDDRIRDVTKFSSADALKRQLEKDIEVIR